MICFFNMYPANFFARKITLQAFCKNFTGGQNYLSSHPTNFRGWQNTSMGYSENFKCRQLSSAKDAGNLKGKQKGCFGYSRFIIFAFRHKNF
jgi:hypothetical protein